jgi:hypothetical protein
MISRKWAVFSEIPQKLDWNPPKTKKTVLQELDL